MELKEYQKTCVDEVKRYLEALATCKAEYDALVATGSRLAAKINFPKAAWEEVKEGLGRIYHGKKNGLGEDLPNFCLKVPTGGGKTLLACHTIGLINTHYLKKQTGLVLWLVPTSQIYRQTLNALRDRAHPYRQILDLNSGGKTLIVTKQDRFAPQDITESLVILLLMLPSTNRQNKEALKIFQDASGFDLFFPPEDRWQDHQTLLQQFPNLDCFGATDSFWGQQIKTSLGNTLRILKPLVVIDEGQKAYSQLAQTTIRGFNPSIVLELSATPPGGSNALIEITGKELDREQMIKLDIHLTNKKSSYNYKDALRDSVAKRQQLRRRAVDYQASTGIYIRPICLIQVERTGKDQRDDTRYIHSEEVKITLIREFGIPEEAIAIKSSEKDDIEGIDLFSPECPICYIITKQALQEGWDCSFAYILTVLTNPTSQNAITQLVGRILRQPFARKTGVRELDESYVFCFQQKASDVINSIRKGLQGEGLGDLAGNIVQEDAEENYIDVPMRDRFKQFNGKVYLPRFKIQQAHGWRELSYEMDLLSRIDWTQADLTQIKTLLLIKADSKDESIALSLSQLPSEVITTSDSTVTKGSLSLDYVYVTRQILDIVPNPWIAYQIAEEVLSTLLKANSNDQEKVASNLVYIVEELRKLLDEERDRLAKEIYLNLIETKQLCFFVQVIDKPDLPSYIKVRKGAKKLIRDNNESLQLSVFDYVDEDDFNDLEKSVAIYLDEQRKLLLWHRNMPKQGYYIQGWKRGRIYSDYIAMQIDENDPDNCSKVCVLETKGLHLKGNHDTLYKQSIFEICNELGKEMDWDELLGSRIEFHLIYEDEWRRKINEIFT